MGQRFRLLHVHSATNLQGRRLWSLADIAAELDRPAKGTWTSPGLATLEEFLTPVRDHTEWSKLGLPPVSRFEAGAD